MARRKRKGREMKREEYEVSEGILHVIRKYSDSNHHM